MQEFLLLNRRNLENIWQSQDGVDALPHCLSHFKRARMPPAIQSAYKEHSQDRLGSQKVRSKGKKNSKSCACALEKSPHIKSDWINYYSTVIVCTVNVLTSACSSSEALNPCSGQSHGKHAFGEDFHLRVSFALPAASVRPTASDIRHPFQQRGQKEGRPAESPDRRDEIFSSGSACGVRKGDFPRRFL